MSYEGSPDFRYTMFDLVHDKNYGYVDRTKAMEEWYHTLPENRKRQINLVMPVMINSLDEFLEYEKMLLDQRYEGVIMRDPKGPFKAGRSTFREGWLMALKRFVDSEAVITGFYELQHNNNEAEENELGHTKRSSSKAGKVGGDTLGGMFVDDLYNKDYTGMKIGGGVGMTAELRQWIWNHREECLGQVIKYKSFTFGVKDLPRNPQFLGFRDLSDLDSSTMKKVKVNLKEASLPTTLSEEPPSLFDLE
jgi:DNA ligase-1